jgi:hypothetical protein
MLNLKQAAADENLKANLQSFGPDPSLFRKLKLCFLPFSETHERALKETEQVRVSCLRT